MNGEITLYHFLMKNHILELISEVVYFAFDKAHNLNRPSLPFGMLGQAIPTCHKLTYYLLVYVMCCAQSSSELFSQCLMFILCFRQLRETVSWMFSEPMIVYYLKFWRDFFWPSGLLAPPAPHRTDEMKVETQAEAKSALIRNIPGNIVVMKFSFLHLVWFESKSNR